MKKLTNGMKMWKGNTTTLLFSLKGLEILHQERRVQVNTIVMKHLNSILLHKSGPAKNSTPIMLINANNHIKIKYMLQVIYSLNQFKVVKNFH